MLITDSGVHIWKAATPDRPWMPGRHAHLEDPIGYEKLSAMMAEAGVDRAILVPPSWEGDRVDYSLEAAQKYPKRFAVMGRIPIDKPEGLKDEARTLAIKDAAAKADLYARAVGYRVKRIVSISENDYQPPMPVPMLQRMQVADQAMATPVAAGEVSLEVQVNVVFELTR